MKKLRMMMVAALILVVLSTVAVAKVGVTGEGKEDAPWAVSGPFELTRPIPLEDADYQNTCNFHPVTKQVIPEGCFGYGFETFLIIYNSSDKPGKVGIVASGHDMYFITSSTAVVQPHQRITFDAADTFLMEGLQGYWENNPDVSFTIFSTQKGIYCEESMYWNHRSAGKSSSGFFVEPTAVQ